MSIPSIGGGKGKLAESITEGRFKPITDPNRTTTTSPRGIGDEEGSIEEVSGTEQGSGVFAMICSLPTRFLAAIGSGIRYCLSWIPGVSWLFAGKTDSKKAESVGGSEKTEVTPESKLLKEINQNLKGLRGFCEETNDLLADTSVVMTEDQRKLLSKQLKYIEQLTSVTESVVDCAQSNTQAARLKMLGNINKFIDREAIQEEMSRRSSRAVGIEDVTNQVVDEADMANILGELDSGHNAL